MFLLNKILGNDSKEEDNDSKVETISSDQQVQDITAKHAEEHGVTEADSGPQAISEEQAQKVEAAPEPSSTSAGGAGSLSVKPYDDGQPDEDRTEENGLDEDGLKGPEDPELDIVPEDQSAIENSQAEDFPPMPTRAVPKAPESEDFPPMPTRAVPKAPESEDLPPQPTREAPRPPVSMDLPPKPTTEAPRPPESMDLPPKPTTEAPKPPADSGISAPTPAPASEPEAARTFHKTSFRNKVAADVGRSTTENEAWRTSLASRKFQDAGGNQRNLFKSSGLDKAELGLSATSGILGVASAGVGMFEKGSFMGDQIGISKEASQDVNLAGGSISLASDALSAVNTGIAIGKNIDAINNRNQFTTDKEKHRQNLSLAANIFNGAGTATNAGSTAAKMMQDKETAGTVGIVSKSLSAIGDTLNIAKTGMELSENAQSREQLEAAIKGSSNEEFKKHARVALQAHDMQRLGSGFNMAKQTTSWIKNVSGIASNTGQALGLSKDTTLGSALSTIGTIGSVIGAAGSVTGILGSFFKKYKKGSRADEQIDAYINTPGLAEKINNTKRYKVTNDDARKVAKRVLGYKTSEEMFSAILINYATSIRKNAESGPDKDNYRSLIAGLGFKLEGNADLPSADEIAQKLSAANA